LLLVLACTIKQKVIKLISFCKILEENVDEKFIFLIPGFIWPVPPGGMCRAVLKLISEF